MAKSLSKTPAPKKDRIFGSDKNKEGSASSKASAKGIDLNDSIIETLTNKAKEYNEKHPNKKVSVATLKAVMRRGMGAYSTSHRPTITGGAPNSRQAWGFARVNKFLKKKAGEQVKAAYVQDDDLMADGGETKKSKDAYTLVGVYESTNELGREESEDLTKEGLIGYRLRYNKAPKEYYGYTAYGDTESELERAKRDAERYNQGAAAEKERKRLKDIENKIKREKQKIIDAQKLEAAKADDSPKPAYLMTISEYQDRVVPLLKEYEKFARKNSEYLSDTSYNDFYKVTFEQVLSRGLEGKKSGYYFRRNDENDLIEDWNQRKFRKYEDQTIPKPTPKDVLEKNIAFFKDLNKFFDEKVIFDGLKSEYKKSNKPEIRRAIEDDTYKKLIEKGEITEEQVIEIAGEHGIKVPKKVFSQESLLKKEAKKQMDEVLSKIPKMNQDVFESLVKQLSKDFEDVEKIVFETETERYEGLIKEYIELSQKEGGVSKDKLMSAIVFWAAIFKNKEPIVIRGRDSRGYPTSQYFQKDLELNSDYKAYMDKIILEYAESLKYRFLYAVMQNFPKVSKPISNISRESIKLGNKGFEGRYRFNFADGSYFDFVTEAIGAAGYNIVAFHYRYLTHLENATLADGTKVKGYYEIMQNFSSDSMADGGQTGQAITCVNCGWHWNTSDSDESDKYICHKCGFDNRTFYDPEPIGVMADGGVIEKGQLIEYSHSDGGSVEAKFLSKVGENKAKIEILNNYTPYTKRVLRTEYLNPAGRTQPANLLKEIPRGTIKIVSLNLIEPVTEKTFKHRAKPISKWLKSTEFKEAFGHLDNPINTMADGGVLGVPSTENLIELVRKERENKIKEWNRLGYRVVVARNDGYSYEKESERDTEFIDAKNPSERKVADIIKNNPDVLEIRFNGTIKAGNRVGEELEIADDFSVLLWKKDDSFFKEGLKFEFVQDGGKYINTIVNKNDTITYKDRQDDGKYVYFKQLDVKYNTESESRSKKDILKEEFDNNEAVFLKDKYADGGLIAPNGKPSNLTPEQYKLVRTPEFKAWFGDWENDPENASKVVDENGEPLVVYRGFNKADDKGFVFKFNVNRFKNNRKTNKFGHYFTISKEVAKEYAEQGEKENEQDVIIKSYFLNIRGLLDITKANKRFPTFEEWSVVKEKGFEYSLYNILQKIKRREVPIHSYLLHDASREAKNPEDLDEVSEIRIKQLENVIARKDADMKEFYNSSETISLPALIHIITGESREVIEEKIKELQENASLRQEAYVNRDVYEWFIKYKSKGFLVTENLDEYLKTLIIDNGYDGVKFIEHMIGSVRGVTDSVYVAFYPNQIKLADGTNTTFDASNPDIRYEDGGALGKSKVYYHGSNTLFKNIKFLENKSGESKHLGDGIYITNDINVAKKYGTYLYEIIAEEPLKSLNYSSAVSKKDMVEIIDIFKNSDDDDLNYLATEYQDDLDDGDLLWGKQLIADLERNGVDVYNTLLDLGYNSIVSPINKLNSFLGWDESSLNINVIKPNILHIISVKTENDKEVNYAQGGVMGQELFKPSKTIEQIAKEKDVPLDYAEEQLRKGMKTESEHSDNPMVQETIALQHLDEMIDYYEKLEYMESKDKMEKGGVTQFYKEYLDWYKDGVFNEMTIMVSVPNSFSKMSGGENDVILDVFEKKDESVNAKVKMKELLEIVDRNGLDIYLEPIPRLYNIKDKAKREKITREYLIKYYEKFGFELLPNGFMVRKHNKMENGGVVPNEVKENPIYKLLLEKSKQDSFTKERVKMPSLDKIGALLRDIGIDVHSNRESKDYLKAGQFYTLIYGYEGQEPLKRIAYHIDISRGDGYYSRNTPYYAKQILKYIDDFYKNNKMEKGGYYKAGGEINPDNKAVKDYFAHGSGNAGGVLVGKRHSEGGIKAVNKSTNQPLEMEGGEVVITRNAVSDTTKREFNGEMLTNREILSKINESGGGVSFAKGGDIPETISTSGKEYKYGGKMMKDHEIVSSCGCNHSMAEGGEVKPEKPIEKMTKLEVMNFIHKIEPTKFFYPRDTKSARVIAEKKYQEYLSKKNMAEGGEISEDLSNYVTLYYKTKLDSDTAASNGNSGDSIRLYHKAIEYENDAKRLIDDYNEKNNTDYSIYDFNRDGILKIELRNIEDSFDLEYLGKYGNKFRFKNLDDGSILEIDNYEQVGSSKVKLNLYDAVSRYYEENYKHGGQTDYHTEIKNHLFPKVEVEVEVEVEPEMDVMPIHEHYITADDLGLSEGMPMLAIGTLVYSSGGNDQWEVVSFSDDGVNLVNKPKSPLQSKMEDKHLTFEELIKYFKDKAISIKNISTERELEPAIALVKNKLPQKSFAVGGLIEGDEDEDARLMQSQFGKTNFK